MLNRVGVRIKGTIAERFWAKVDKADVGCWDWVGAGGRAANGYGTFWTGERFIGAHRMAYELSVGAVPEGLELDHLCSNKLCCNPDHMEAVTRQVNIGRAAGTGFAINAAKTHCKWGHEFSADNTYSRPGGARGCYECKRRRRNEAYRRTGH